jgi:integrase
VRGDGRVWKPKNTRYFWCSYYLNGTNFRESTKSTELAAAQRFLKNKLKEVGSAQLGHSVFTGPAAARLTVGDLLDALEENKRRRGRTSVASATKVVRAKFGLHRAMAVSSKAVGKWIDELLADGYKPATVNRVTQLLGQSFRLAIKQKLLATAPDIPHLSEAGNTRKGFVSRTQLDAIRAGLPEYLRDLALFGFLSSWRLGEILTLEWSAVHADSIVLRAENSKERESRSLALEGDLAELIKRRRKVANGAHVFHNAGHRIVDLRKAWRTACKLAGMAGTIFHDLRRSGVSEMVRAGVPIQVAKSISGHKSDSMFQRYSILGLEDQRRAMRTSAEFVQAIEVPSTARVQ